MKAKSLRILVTGANRGIGLEFAQQLLTQGHHVIATTRNPAKATELQAFEKTFPTKFKSEVLDVASDLSVTDWIARSQVRDGVDLVISNAGIFLGEPDGFESMNLASVRESFEVNTLGGIRVVKAALPSLLKSQNPTIVHITSLMGSISDNASGGYYSYRISKAALNMFNKSFSIDYPQITSIVMHPGWVQTDMGGPNATTTKKESVSGMIKVISELKKSDSGGFFDFRGKRLSW